jgi:excisionase family DNA binding protein
MKALKGEIVLPKSLVNRIVRKLLKKIQPELQKVRKNDADALFDIKGLAGYLKVKQSWIYKRTSLNEIPFIKLANRQVRFRKRDIDSWLQSLSMPSVSDFRGK